MPPVQMTSEPSRWQFGSKWKSSWPADSLLKQCRPVGGHGSKNGPLATSAKKGWPRRNQSPLADPEWLGLLPPIGSTVLPAAIEISQRQSIGGA